MENKKTKKEVLIVGAGPSGLSLAAALTKLNIAVKIIELKPKLSDTTKATNLMQGTQEQLAVYGLIDPMLKISGKMERIVMEGYGVNLGARTMHMNESPFKDVLLLGQDNIEQCLAGSLNELGIKIDFENKLIGLKQKDEGVYATIQKGNDTTEEFFNYVVGCDGPWGVTRTFTKCNFEPVKTNRTIRQLDAKLKWKRLNSMKQMWLFYFSDGFAVVVPLLDDYFRIITIEPSEKIPNRNPTLDELKYKLIEVTNDNSIELLEPKWFSYANLNMGIAPNLIDRHVILAGDAGNPILPNGGQGLNTGIQDSLNLAWKLAAVLKGNAGKKLLNTYEEERLSLRTALEKVQYQSLKYTTKAPKFMQWLVRKFGNKLLNMGGEYQMARAFSQLNVNYQNSSLTVKNNKSKVSSGTRILDADIVKASSLKEVSLFNELCMPVWKLVIFDNGKTIGSIDTFLDTMITKGVNLLIVSCLMNNNYDKTYLYYDIDRLAHKTYDVKTPLMLLIRPDNFIAARVDANSKNKILQYFDDISLAD